MRPIIHAAKPSLAYIALGAALAASSAHAATLPPSTGISLLVDAQYPQYQNSSAQYSSQPQQYFQFTGLKQSLTPGDTLTTNPGAMPGGLTSGSLTLNSGNSGDYAYASADMAEGVIRAEADTGAGSSANYAEGRARVIDALTFNITDGAPAALVDIHVHLDGAEAGAGLDAGSYSNNLAFALGGTFNYFSYISNNGNSGYGFAGQSGYQTPGGWQTYSTTGDSLTGFDFYGVLSVYNGYSPDVYFDMDVGCQGVSVQCDFAHTADVSITTPSDVTFTSGSGLFLTGAGGVPEPATWAMMLVGFGGLGAAMRSSRRRRALIA